MENVKQLLLTFCVIRASFDSSLFYLQIKENRHPCVLPVDGTLFGRTAPYCVNSTQSGEANANRAFKENLFTKYHC